MSQRVTRWVLFLVMAAFAPAPVWIGAGGFLPPVATAIAMMGPFVATLGQTRFTAILAALGVTILVVGVSLLCLWWLAFYVAWKVSAATHGARTAVITAVIAGFVLVGFLPIYGISVHGPVKYKNVVSVYAEVLGVSG